MPRNTIIAVACVCLLLSQGVSRAAAESNSLTVAVIAVRDPSNTTELVSAQLTERLSKTSGIILVERKEIDRILQEQQMSLENASDPNTTLRLGQLLGADALLFVERAAGVEPASVLLRIVETRTAIVVAELLEPDSDIKAGIDPIIASLITSLHKTKVPDEDRHYVGILGLTSGDMLPSVAGPTTALPERLATTLTTLLAHDLKRSEKLFVLERKRLKHIMEEHELSGIDQKLRLSTILVDGRIRYNEDKREEILITLRCRGLSGEQLKDTIVAAPADNTAVMRTKLCQAAMEALTGESFAELRSNSKEEAAVYAERANSLFLRMGPRGRSRGKGTGYRLGELDEVAAWAETALALDKSVNCAEILFEYYMAEAFNPMLSVSERLKMRLCAAEVNYERSRQIVQSKTNASWSLTMWCFEPAHHPEKPTTDQEACLASEIRARCLQTYQLLHDYLGEGQDYWTLGNLLRARLCYAPILADTFDQFSKDVRSLVEEFDHAWTVSKEPIPLSRGGFYDELVGLLSPSPYLGRNFCYVWPKEQMFPLQEWLATRPDPSVQVLGFWAMLGTPHGTSETCVEILDRVFFEKVEVASSWSPDYMASHCAGALPDRDVYFESVLMRAERAKDARPFVDHPHLVKLFLSRGVNSAQTWAQRILAIVDASKEFASHDGQSAGLITVLADYIPNLPKPVREVVKTADPWTNFVFQPIEMLGRDLEAHRQLVWTHFDRHAGDLVFVWLSDRTNVLVITRMDVHGGKLRSCGEIDDLRWKWHGGHLGNSYIACSTDSPDHTFFGVYGCDPLELEKNWPVGVGFIGPWGCGLAMVGKGDVEVFRLSEKGLHGDCNTISWLGEYLYIGSDDALFRFDPKTRQFRTIASSKALPGKNKLNGDPAYRIGSLVSDPTRDILWIFVGGDKRDGIWKFSPASDDAWLLPDSSIPDCRMFKSADKLVCGGSCGSRFRFINFDDKSTAATNVCQYPPDSFNRMLKPRKGNPLVLVNDDIIDRNGNIIKADGTMGHFSDTLRWSAIESYKNGFIAVSANDNPVQIWYVERKKQKSSRKQ